MTGDNPALFLHQKAKEMKRITVLMLVLFMTMSMAAREKSNIQVWGEVKTAADGKDYLTMYKNCPAQVTAQFHFVYKDKTKSVMYDIIMPDTVAQVNDPVPVDKPVKEVVVDNIVYSTLDADGKKYSTSNPDDPVLAMLLVDLFDLYHDVFWFDAVHRAGYYSNSFTSSGKHKPTGPENINLDKLDDTALLLGAAAVAAASVGMAFAVSQQWDVPDERFPYISLSPQVQYFFQTGTIRDVVEFKVRTGNYGGLSFMCDIGYTTGSLNYPEIFNPGFTWSLGAGMDIGAFSMSFRLKPRTKHYYENFLSCQLGYDISVSKNLAIDLRTGVGTFGYNDDVYVDVPLSVGLLWKF